MTTANDISAVILAGGRGSRLGGQDKGLLPLAGKPLIQHVIGRIAPQVSHIIISANRHQHDYQRLGYPVVSDDNNQFLGPLAGIAAAMAICPTAYLLVVSCDTPFLPRDLASTMQQQLTQHSNTLCLAHDGERLQPLLALLPVSLLGELQQDVAAGNLKVSRWMEEHHPTIVNIDTEHAFFNINTAHDLQTAAEILAIESPSA